MQQKFFKVNTQNLTLIKKHNKFSENQLQEKFNLIFHHPKILSSDDSHQGHTTTLHFINSQQITILVHHDVLTNVYNTYALENNQRVHH
jgi:hypothetical protein